VRKNVYLMKSGGRNFYIEVGEWKVTAYDSETNKPLEVSLIGDMERDDLRTEAGLTFILNCINFDLIQLKRAVNKDIERNSMSSKEMIGSIADSMKKSINKLMEAYGHEPLKLYGNTIPKSGETI